MTGNYLPAPRHDWGEREKYRQARRKSRSPRDKGDVQLSEDVEAAFDLVPSLGEGRRWYDPPYLALMWLSSGWRRKVQPAALLGLWNKGINYLIPFNEHHRDFVWPRDNWMHSVRVPADEHVNVAGIWAVELFPPAELPALERAIAKNGWDKRRPLGGPQDDNRATLTRARSGTGTTWWRLASLIRKGSSWWVVDGIRTDLPEVFETVQLRAIQVGEGLTAVVADFHLGDKAAKSLDEVWHTEHEPFMRFPRGRRPLSYDRHWGTFWKVQSARAELHNEARRWLAQRLPGYFGRRREPHPLLDLLLLDKFDPTKPEPANISRDKSLRRRDALRALGVDLFSHDDHVLTDCRLLERHEIVGRT